MKRYWELLDTHEEPTMNDMQLIICESTGDWAAELERRLPPSVSLVETRSLEEMWERLHSSPDLAAARIPVARPHDIARSPVEATAS